MNYSVNKITEMLLAELWDAYIHRVNYAQTYVDLVIAKGGKVINDHIAIRTLNTHTGEQPEGINAIKHILNFLNYSPKDSYKFSKKKLTAVHFEHPNPEFPKIFVSQLEVTELPDWAQKIISETVVDTPYLISNEAINLLNILHDKKSLPIEAAEILIAELAGYFRRPWDPPKKEFILKLNDISQYAAWVLLHGNSINHFTAFINFHEVKEWPDLASTCEGLKKAGVPMKETIEGEKDSILQQSATQAVKEEVVVVDDQGNPENIKWTYAYYELAQRGMITENGKEKLFSGFLGEQAAHLFDMTKTRDN